MKIRCMMPKKVFWGRVSMALLVLFSLSACGKKKQEELAVSPAALAPSAIKREIAQLLAKPLAFSIPLNISCASFNQEPWFLFFDIEGAKRTTSPDCAEIARISDYIPFQGEPSCVERDGKAFVEGTLLMTEKQGERSAFSLNCFCQDATFGPTLSASLLNATGAEEDFVGVMVKPTRSCYLTLEAREFAKCEPTKNIAIDISGWQEEIHFPLCSL